MRFLLTALLLTLSLATASAREAFVYINNASAELFSGETVSIRFTTQMYDVSAGGSRPPTPVTISPNIPTLFEWTSPVSGVLRFKAAPQLNSEYVIAPRPDLADATGTPVTLDKTRLTSVRTPPFKLVRHHVSPREYNYFEDERYRHGTSRTPIVYLAFNAAISAPHVIPHLSFISDKGERIQSVLAAAPEFLQSMAASDRPWSSAWTGNTDERCGLFLSPASPLIPGQLWELSVPSHLTGNANNIPVGFVQQFRRIGASFFRHPLKPPQLDVRFSQPFNLPKPNRSQQPQDEASLASKNFTLSINNGPASIIIPENQISSLLFQVPSKAGDLWRLNIPELTTRDGQTLPPSTIEQRVPKLVPRLLLSGKLLRHAPKDQKEIELLCVGIPRVKFTLHQIPTSNAAAAFEVWTKTYDRLDAESESDPNSKSKESPAQTLDRMKGNMPKLRVDPLQIGAYQIHEEIITPNYADSEAVIHRIPWTKLLGENGTGMYLVTAEEFDSAKTIQRPLRSGVQQLVQRSNLSIQLLNAGRQSALCIANSAASGNPLPGVMCTFLNSEWKPLKQVVTEANGTATIEKANVAFVQASRDNEVLIFEAGTGFVRNGLPDEKSSAPIQTLLFTDRHIYRPGETAHAKFIARETIPGSIHPPKAGKQPWDLKGPQGRTVDSGHIELSDRGSANVDVRLPSIPGPYVLTIGEEKSRFFSSTSLTIAEFEPDAFEINLKVPAQVTCPGPALIDVDAHYLSGLPLSEKNARWALNLNPQPFHPTTLPNHSFSANWHDWRLGLNQIPFSARAADETALGKNGKAKLSIPIPVPRILGRLAATITVQITDTEDQTLEADAGFTVDSSSFYLGVKRPSTWKRKLGKSIPISIVAVDLSGKSVAPPNPVAISVQPIRWKSTITKTPSGERVEYSYDLGPVHSVPVSVTALPMERDQISVPQSHQSVDLSFLEPGEYLAEVKTTDESERNVSTNFSFSIHEASPPALIAASQPPDEEEDRPRFYSGDFPVKLISDKAVYEPGETASLSLRSPVHGTATVCIGAQPIVKMQTLPVHPGLNGIELPITDALIPGNQISVTIVEAVPPGAPIDHAARSAIAHLNISVHPRDKRLTVSILNIPEDARPGTVLSPKVRVSDANGKPLSDAEVTLYAVDEGVLRLSGYDTPDPDAALYPTVFQSITNLSSRNVLRSWYTWDARLPFANKGYLVGGGGEDASGMRNHFEFTPLWIPSGQTNAKGEFTATLKVPDNISAYRIMAVVHHAGHRFGKTETRLRVNKPLQINPGIPQFVNRGDTVEIRCSVQNTTPNPTTIELSFEPSGGAIVSGPKKITASLPENSTTPFNFRTSFPQTGNIELKWKVRSTDGKESDGLQLPLTVRTPFPIRHQTIVARVTDQPFNLLGEIDAELLEGEGQAAISLSRDPAVQLEGMIDSLLRYPYGCAEQTMSSMFPWILSNSFPVKHLRKDARRGAIQKGLHRLNSMLTPEGRIAYWPIISPELRQSMLDVENWVTAYVGLGLALMRQDADHIIAKAAGEELETSVFGYMKSLLAKPDPLPREMDTLCLAACAMAMNGTPDHAANERLFSNIQRLNACNRALLAIAMHLSKTASEPVLASLFEPIALDEFQPPFQSHQRTRAIRLLSLSLCDRAPEEQQSLFNELILGSGFAENYTTQDHVWRLIAAQRYLAAQQVADEPTSLSWTFANSNSNETLTKNAPTSEHTLRWHGVKNRLKPASIQRKNEAPLFASIKVSSAPIEPQAPQNQGFNLTRTINPDNNPLAVGDVVEIKIVVKAHQASSFVALECPLPSLLEPLQGFETRGNKHLLPIAAGSSHSETRADRILFFWNDMPAGEYVALARARVRASGDVSIPATRVEAMYRPQQFSETAVERLVVP
ncbi:MAG: hypothetical protein RIS92_472 [Verrucomicrobiota bacterium]|jgi:uncharacterized protein YfaS (alpha-2-macroglobulin family)